MCILGQRKIRADIAEGNVRQIVDSSDNVVAYYEYDPFGKLISKGGTYADANRYRHATKPYDEDTGLYYYTYRHYNPENGRWINRDPIAEAGGLNLYAFCFNNSINLWDLWGFSKSETTSDSDPITKNQLIRELRERLKSLNEHDQRDLRKVIREIYNSQQNGGSRYVDHASADNFIGTLDKYIDIQNTYDSYVNEVSIREKLVPDTGITSGWLPASEDQLDKLSSVINELANNGGLMGKMMGLDVISGSEILVGDGEFAAANFENKLLLLNFSSSDFLGEKNRTPEMYDNSEDPLVVVGHELSHLLYNARDPISGNINRGKDTSIMGSIGFENLIRSSLGYYPRTTHHSVKAYPNGFEYVDIDSI